MFKGKSKNRGTPEVPQASMGDIAFLLLVFFLVTTSFDMDQGLNMILPGMGEGVKVKRKNIVKVIVDASGGVTLMGEGIGSMPVPLNQLKSTINSMYAQNKNLIVTIQTSGDCKYQGMISVLNEIKKTPVDKISFSKLQETGG